MKIGSIVLAGLGIFAVVFAGTWTALKFKPQAQTADPILIPTVTAPTLEVQNAAKTLPDFRAAAKVILPSIVSITTLVEGENWFGERFIEPSGSGSGVVLSKSGHIITNYHVISSNRRQAARILVKFSDGKTSEAKLIGSDSRSDIAVLKVERPDLTPIQVGDSTKLEVGEWVVAAGNPLGFEQTVSVGIVSSKGRPLKSDDYAIFVDGIQTDAAINKGNSGGALCDAQGRLVGINTLIASTDQGSIGIGFAIPVNRVQSVVDEILKYGRARYGRIGLIIHNNSNLLAIERFRQQFARQVGSESEPPSKGIVIARVLEGPAAEAGIQPLDIITKIDDKPMDEIENYQVFMANKKPGEKLTISVWRQGQTKAITVTLTEAQI
jgi:S1-C subfamily serine protease